MDKISRIVAAALLASSIASVTPAVAVDTTASDFVVALSSDFSSGDLVTIQAKLAELQRLGIEGIMVDDEMMSVERLLALLNEVQNGSLAGSRVAASLLAAINSAVNVRFINGGIYSLTADLNVGTVPGSVFPAGSAG